MTWATGDANPGSTFLDHALRFQEMDEIKMIVILGELGGDNEYGVVEALRAKKITKPVVAWVWFPSAFGVRIEYDVLCAYVYLRHIHATGHMAISLAFDSKILCGSVCCETNFGFARCVCNIYIFCFIW
jgi:succinyl-CoA synthetase alpha subunit